MEIIPMINNERLKNFIFIPSPYYFENYFGYCF